MSKILPILYSFRRCPYAMRARMALYYSGINCELREVSLRNKPNDLIAISSKATVPVMQFSDGKIIDESLDIMNFAIEQNDPDGFNDISKDVREQIKNLICANDTEFAKFLRQYKYFESYPEQTQQYYRLKIEETYLKKYESLLEGNKFLLGKESVADLAILPFIRQFAFVDKEWFFCSSYNNLIKWLKSYIDAGYFDEVILAKNTPWKKGDKPVYFI